MHAIDTNLWIYCHDTRDTKKQAVALKLIESIRPLALPWQVGCEFIAACRKLAPVGMDEEMAWGALTEMEAMADIVLLPTQELWRAARELQSRYSLSFWDALLVAACIHGQVKILYTEDLGAPREIEGVTLINPFLGNSTP